MWNLIDFTFKTPFLEFPQVSYKSTLQYAKNNNFILCEKNKNYCIIILIVYEI